MSHDLTTSGMLTKTRGARFGQPHRSSIPHRNSIIYTFLLIPLSSLLYQLYKVAYQIFLIYKPRNPRFLCFRLIFPELRPIVVLRPGGSGPIPFFSLPRHASKFAGWHQLILQCKSSVLEYCWYQVMVRISWLEARMAIYANNMPDLVILSRR